MGPDPVTGLLTSSFILYYGVSNVLSDDAGNLTINDINGTLGIVSVKDPIYTLQVSQPTIYFLYTCIYIIYIYYKYMDHVHASLYIHVL